jgi:hypothetical protein
MFDKHMKCFFEILFKSRQKKNLVFIVEQRQVCGTPIHCKKVNSSVFTMVK